MSPQWESSSLIALPACVQGCLQLQSFGGGMGRFTVQPLGTHQWEETRKKLSMGIGFSNLRMCLVSFKRKVYNFQLNSFKN